MNTICKRETPSETEISEPETTALALPSSNASGFADAINYVCKAKDVIKLNIVYDVERIKQANILIKRSFGPKMVHQLFPQSELIYGYKNLSIKIYFLANTYKCYVDVKYSSTCEENPHTAPPDNIITALNSWLPIGYCTEKREFCRAIAQETHDKVYGKRIGFIPSYEEESSSFIVTQCSIEEEGFKSFHQRFESLIVWFIDAASQIDVDDENWMYFYIYEEMEIRKKTGETALKKKKRIYPIGYCTIYKFFHYPDKIRARISQFFIIPPSQGAGLGSALLRAVYSVIRSLPNTIDITVEDPCIEFTKMRNILDSNLLMSLDCFKPPAILQGFSEQMYKKANSKYKINRHQCHRIYQILRVFHTASNIDLDNIDQLGDEILKHVKCPLQKAVKKKKIKANFPIDDQIYQSSQQIIDTSDNAEYRKLILWTAKYLQDKYKS